MLLPRFHSKYHLDVGNGLFSLEPSAVEIAHRMVLLAPAESWGSCECVPTRHHLPITTPMIPWQ
eukprot:5702381-Ditylum_brightwellii.AAC.1